MPEPSTPEAVSRASRSVLLAAIATLATSAIMIGSLFSLQLTGNKPWPWQCQAITNDTQAVGADRADNDAGLTVKGRIVDPGSSCYIVALVYTPATGSHSAGGATFPDKNGNFTATTDKLVYPDPMPVDVVIEVAVGDVYCVNGLASYPSTFRGDVPPSCTVVPVTTARVAPR